MVATQYDLIRRLEEAEAEIKRLKEGGRSDSTPGYQLLPNGIPFFPAGMSPGRAGDVVYEPAVLPTATGLVLAWGASDDTIFIDASWLAPTGYGADQIAAYLVQAYKTADGPSGVPIEDTVNGGLSLRLQPVESNTEYRVVVAAVSRTGRNATGIQATITTGGDTVAPAAPTFPASPVIAGVEALAVRWNANTERDVANGKGQYRVIVSTASNLASPVFDRIVGTGTYFWVPDLEAGTPYYVGVRAVDSSGNQSPVAQPSGGPWTPLPVVTTEVAILEGGGNVVKNSGLEDPVALAGWTSFLGGTTHSAVTSNSHGSFGTRALQIAGTGDSYVYQDVVLSRGTYVFSAWTKGTSLAGAGAGASINFEATVGTLANVAVVLGTNWNSGRATAGKGTFDWTRIASKFDVTTASATVRLYLQRGGAGSVSGTAWYDEVQLEAGKTLTSYAPRPDELLSASILATHITDAAITTPKLAANSVVAGKVAANTIGAAEIIAASITGANIAADTITGTNIAANSIDTAELKAEAVDAVNIKAFAVQTGKLAANAVTADKLAAVAIAVDKFIQSSNYFPGVSGWRIDGAGNAEFNNATVRGSTFVGGSIDIAERIFAAPGDPAVHLSANIDIGAGFSGTIYSGLITDGGFQMATNAGVKSTLMRARLGQVSHLAGIYDMTSGRNIFAIVGGSQDAFFYGPFGRLINRKRGQTGGIAGAGLLIESAGELGGGGSNTEAVIALHTPDYGVATVLKHYGPLGSGLEIRDGNDNNFAAAKASAFIVSSAAETKTDIEDMPSTTAKVKDLKTKRFKRQRVHCTICKGTGKVVSDESLAVGDKCPRCKGKKGSPSIPQPPTTYGFLAEDVAAVLPEAVVMDGGKADAIDVMALVAVLTQKVQELDAEVAQLKAVS